MGWRDPLTAAAPVPRDLLDLGHSFVAAVGRTAVVALHIVAARIAGFDLDRIEAVRIADYVDSRPAEAFAVGAVGAVEDSLDYNQVLLELDRTVDRSLLAVDHIGPAVGIHRRSHLAGRTGLADWSRKGQTL